MENNYLVFLPGADKAIVMDEHALKQYFYDHPNISTPDFSKIDILLENKIPDDWDVVVAKLLTSKEISKQVYGNN